MFSANMIRNAEAAARCLTVVLGVFQLRSQFTNSLPAIHDIASLYSRNQLLNNERANDRQLTYRGLIEPDLAGAFDIDVSFCSIAKPVLP